MKPCHHGIPDPTLCDICETMKVAKNTKFKKHSQEVLKAVALGKAEIDDAGNVGWIIP